MHIYFCVVFTLFINMFSFSTIKFSLKNIPLHIHHIASGFLSSECEIAVIVYAFLVCVLSNVAAGMLFAGH